MRRVLAAFVALALVTGSAAVVGAADTTIGQKVDDTAVQAKVKAERLARATDGVREVQNDLAVTSPSASPSTK